jgi:predicted CXXCH cytochrome family protein
MQPRFVKVFTQALLCAMLLSGCSKKEPSAPAAVLSESIPTNPHQEEPRLDYAFDESLPHLGVEGYVGSQSCVECHKDEHASWHRSYHRTMTQVASTNSIQADFNNVILTNDNTRFTLFQKTNEFWVRMEPIAGEGVGSGVETRIGLITGSHHMQVFWVPEGTGNLQIGFPFTWLIPEKRWVPRNSTFIRPPEFEHRPEAWNVVCSRCHSTGLEPRFDAANRTVETHVAELGISCEACHGPAKRHVELRTAQLSSPAPKLEPGEIIHPEKLTAERSAQTCGFCHSMKWIDKSENWRSDGFKFRPGEDLEKTTPIILKSRTNSIPGLTAYLARNPEIMRDFFWSDGMIRVSGRELNGVMESPCYKGGKFSCLSCHSGHDSEPDDLLTPAGRTSAACLQCHEKFTDQSQLTTHTRHSPASSGSDCYNCHMPHTTYGVLKGIRSHQITSPRVQDDTQTGRPNACNLCHLDQTLDWTAQHLKAWYGQEIPQILGPKKSASHAVRLALTGDAGQRAIIAWHLGWSPAQNVSGTNWITPLLGQLLDDPYAAVRLVAERSSQSFGLPLENYDFTLQPSLRSSMRERLWNVWLESVEKNPTDHSFSPDSQVRLLLSPADLERQRQAYEELLGWRDHRPVRLRE